MKCILFPPKKLDQRVDSNNPLIQPMVFHPPNMEGSAGITIISRLDIRRVVQEFRSRPKEGLRHFGADQKSVDRDWELHEQEWYIDEWDLIGLDRV